MPSIFIVQEILTVGPERWAGLEVKDGRPVLSRGEEGKAAPSRKNAKEHLGCRKPFRDVHQRLEPRSDRRAPYRRIRLPDSQNSSESTRHRSRIIEFEPVLRKYMSKR